MFLYNCEEETVYSASYEPFSTPTGVMWNILRTDIWCLVMHLNGFQFFLLLCQNKYFPTKWISWGFCFVLLKSLYFPASIQRVFSNKHFLLFHSLITHWVLFEILRCSPGVGEDIEKLDACRQNTLGRRKHQHKWDGLRFGPYVRENCGA